MKSLRWLLAGTFAFLAGLQLLPYLVGSPRGLAVRGLIADDAFFYSVLARNFHRHGFLTLDGAMPTNGVQPLWMAIQIALVKLFPEVPALTLLARSSWVAYVAFAFLAVWYASQQPAPRGTIAALFVGALVAANPHFQAMVIRGLEVPLVLLLICVLLFYVDALARRVNFSPLHAAGLAVVTSLCFLGRLDLFWIPVAGWVWLLLRGRGFRRHAVIYAVVVAVLVLPYLAWNLASQGALMPISGRVKLYQLSLIPDWREYVASNEWRALPTALAGLVPGLRRSLAPSIACTIAVLGFGFAVAWRARRSAEFPAGLKLLTGVVAAHLAYMHLAHRELRPYSAYYFAPEVLWVALVSAYSPAALRGRWPASTRDARILRAAPAVAAALALVVMTVAWSRRTMEPTPYWAGRVELAERFDNRVPEEARVGAFWPGCLAYFSARPVTPLDGLAGSGAFLEDYIKRGRELEYVVRNGRGFVALHSWRPLDETLARAPEELRGWPKIGLRRLIENRDRFALRALDFRPTNPQGGGWYLIELTRSPKP